MSFEPTTVDRPDGVVPGPTSVRPTLVCPLNGAPRAERALPYAYEAAALLDGHLHLTSAVEDDHMVSLRQRYLAGCVGEQRVANGQLPTVGVIVDPHAPQALAKLAGDPTAFVVMATSTAPLLHDGYVGSAAERVTRSAHNAVLLCGPSATVPLSDVTRVVVPCDGSRLSEQVIDEAKEWAIRLGVRLWIITVISPDAARAAGLSSSSESGYVRRLAREVDAEWEVLHGVDPAKSIVGWAGAALIAMTTHGRSGLSRFTMGSVTVGTTRWSSGPVLVSNGQPPSRPEAHR